MASPLAGRVALVTGASRGIGLATARVFADAGASVARLARRLESHPAHDFLDLPCDVTRDAAVRDAVAALVDQRGVPDVVVNNAGGFILRSIADTTPDDFDDQIAVNLGGGFRLVHALVPHFRQVGTGHLITVGSVSDYRAFPDNAAYTASKFGLRGFHEAVAVELKPYGVRATLISPGATDTSLWDEVDIEAVPGLLPRTAMLRPDDVAQAILFAATRPPHANIDVIRLSPSA